MGLTSAETADCRLGPGPGDCTIGGLRHPPPGGPPERSPFWGLETRDGGQLKRPQRSQPFRPQLWAMTTEGLRGRLWVLPGTARPLLGDGVYPGSGRSAEEGGWPVLEGWRPSRWRASISDMRRMSTRTCSSQNLERDV